MEQMVTSAPPGTTAEEGFTREEVQLATRNHGMPLEALRHQVTPVGLHYTLIHFDIPVVAAGDWRLEIGGRVRRPLSLTLAELQTRTTVTRAVTMECAGNGRARLSPRPVSQPWLLEAVGNAEWTGTPLREVLAEAEMGDDAVEVVFEGADRGVEGGVEQAYARALPLAEALAGDVLLAWAMNGGPLPPQHGFPLRLLVPGWYGMTSVKWLTRITVVERPFEGYQQARAYRLRKAPEEPGEPVTRMLPRSLVAPPGIPDFLTRRRFVPVGACRLEGRAWSGWAPVVRVEVSTDGGATWHDAQLGDQPDPRAWRAWSYVWHAAQPGEYELTCRATDAAGNAQPLEHDWNLGGYAGTAVQRIPVTVTG